MNKSTNKAAGILRLDWPDTGAPYIFAVGKRSWQSTFSIPDFFLEVSPSIVIAKFTFLAVNWTRNGKYID